jgi:hypothetical protein
MPPSAGELEQQVTTAELLQRFWRRPVAMDAVVDGGPLTITGTVVGLGQVVAVLTPNGVIDVPTDAVLTVTDPTGA